ncbi:MAG: bifunctional DNA-formamidopyrimidine glycosylase/DNA-(apurinic or apyrimidinic site) lyase [bacterium]|nr:bifunctional DNA-formamidopyrimidine glycosylase/DNA-(apurinic or apyrimidinic site) lyase [bacterium]
MPELPEVETVRRALVKCTRHQIITQYYYDRTDYLQTGHTLCPALAGSRIETVERRGKLLAIRLSKPFVLLHHLGMSGRILHTPQEAPLAKHTHLRIRFQNGWELRQWDPRRFGYAAVFRDEEILEYAPWAEMGADPLMVSPQQFFALVQGRNKPIKHFLLDQSGIAGVGNIYADEALFRAKIHPCTPCAQLTQRQIGQLLQHLQHVLEESIAAGGSSTHDFQTLDGTLGAFQHQHRVYRRTGLPCPGCQHPIEKTVTAGRSTHFCPRCQPWPTPIQPA